MCGGALCAMYGMVRNLSLTLAHHTLVTGASRTTNCMTVRITRKGILKRDRRLPPADKNHEFDFLARFGPLTVRKQFPLCSLLLCSYIQRSTPAKGGR